ncbi:hypothetical protein C8J57DRAFT_1522183 [Mycena rebaudengoi]|nr:hypothetical protein C8J57DRAFT_1522183 [Mycena rebaudengoi]
MHRHAHSGLLRSILSVLHILCTVTTYRTPTQSLVLVRSAASTSAHGVMAATEGKAKTLKRRQHSCPGTPTVKTRSRWNGGDSGGNGAVRGAWIFRRAHPSLSERHSIFIYPSHLIFHLARCSSSTPCLYPPLPALRHSWGTVSFLPVNSPLPAPMLPRILAVLPIISSCFLFLISPRIPAPPEFLPPGAFSSLSPSIRPAFYFPFLLHPCAVLALPPLLHIPHALPLHVTSPPSTPPVAILPLAIHPIPTIPRTASHPIPYLFPLRPSHSTPTSCYPPLAPSSPTPNSMPILTLHTPCSISLSTNPTLTPNRSSLLPPPFSLPLPLSSRSPPSAELASHIAASQDARAASVKDELVTSSPRVCLHRTPNV